MSGLDVAWVPKHEPHYITVGSVLGRVSPSSVVWGTGSFGSEHAGHVTRGDGYLAVRGPLTRARLEMFKQSCPRTSGDPALLVADYHPAVDHAKLWLGTTRSWAVP